MKLAAVLCLLACFAVCAAEKPDAVTVDGKTYSQIQDVHIVSGGRIVILYPGGGVTLSAAQLPHSFMDAWGIAASDLAESKRELERESADSLEKAIRSGMFREVDGVVYDLRKAQPGWVQFSSAKVLQVLDDGVLLDPTPNQATATVVYVRNASNRILSDNDRVTTMAKLTGHVTLESRLGIQRTIRCYDVGRPCGRNEIPEAMLKEGKPWAEMASVLHPKHAPLSVPDRTKLRAVGSGFFVTDDGYLLTNYHVVENAESVRVKCATNFWPAEIAKVDKTNDVALLKVSGTNFHALALSRRKSARLGETVFTIGFPNIDVQGMEPKYTDGKISSLSGVLDDPFQYQISVPVQPGNSGGPLCDTNGTVIGIVVARLSDMALLHTSGSLPQNVNYAVKAGLALELLRHVPELALADETTSSAATPPVESVANSVAMVLVY
jgi:S1-C subfamily serine protease